MSATDVGGYRGAFRKTAIVKASEVRVENAG